LQDLQRRAISYTLDQFTNLNAVVRLSGSIVLSVERMKFGIK